MALDPQKQARADEITATLREDVVGKKPLLLTERVRLRAELAGIFGTEQSSLGALAPEKQGRIDQINALLRPVALNEVYMAPCDRAALANELSTLLSEPPPDAGGSGGGAA